MKVFKVYRLLSIVLITLCLCFNFEIKAQTDYEDFTYLKQSIKERKIVPYPSLIERDAAFSGEYTGLLIHGKK